MVMGRPKEWDRDAVAAKLVEWAKKDDSINLNAFCTTHDPLIPPYYISVWAKENKNFSQAYNIAKSFISARREQKLNNQELHVKAYDLNASVYDHFLKTEKRAEKEFESELKKKESQAYDEKMKESFGALMTQVSDQQKFQQFIQEKHPEIFAQFQSSQSSSAENK